MPKDELLVTRILNASRERVFAAFTRPELMARWFFPGDGWSAKATSDLRVGGRYELSMRDTAGGGHVQFGEYQEIVPVCRLVFTWSCPELSVVNSVVTVELVELGECTELRLRHSLLADSKVRQSHEEGWLGCLYRGFWNTVAEVEENVGGKAKLRFIKDGTPVNMEFVVDELVPNERVRWTCTAHDLESWVGTRLNWEIQAMGDGSRVRFEHDGWKGEAPEPVAQGWKHFVKSLKAYVETGRGEPW